MRKRNVLMALLMVTVYVALPAYRYYAIGSYIGYKILFDKQSGYKIVSKKNNQIKGA